MAHNTVDIFYYPSNSIYFVVYNLAGKIWNGSTFVTLVTANWSTYIIPMTEVDPSNYTATFPTAPPDTYYIAAFKYTVTPTITDTLIGYGSIIWDGHFESEGSGGTNNEQIITTGVREGFTIETFVTGSDQTVPSVTTFVRDP